MSVRRLAHAQQTRLQEGTALGRTGASAADYSAQRTGPLAGMASDTAGASAADEFAQRTHPLGQAVSERAGGDATEYLSGEVLADRYRLVRELGRGGMGVVWEARSLALEVDVALKLLRVRGSEPEMASRMAREAHASARLAHPALVRVFDFGTTNRGHPFLVMELVRGETLCTVLTREGRMGAIRAVQTLLPVADGLRCAHGQGIVHRDVKPENLFIAKDSFGRLQPKLIDFGIARIGQSTTDPRLTQEGVVMGSPAYMSPEQALGHENIDGRSDLWAMCVMLYEMITGRLPFRNKNYNALMQAILHQEPIPTLSLGAGDAELWQIIAKGLAKTPAARYANATALGDAMALWLHRHGVKEDVCGNSIRALWLHPIHLQTQNLPEIQVNPETLTQTETRAKRAVATVAEHAEQPRQQWPVALTRAIASPFLRGSALTRAIARSLRQPVRLTQKLGTWLVAHSTWRVVLARAVTASPFAHFKWPAILTRKLVPSPFWLATFVGVALVASVALPRTRPDRTRTPPDSAPQAARTAAMDPPASNPQPATGPPVLPADALPLASTSAPAEGAALNAPLAVRAHAARTTGVRPSLATELPKKSAVRAAAVAPRDEPKGTVRDFGF